MISNTGWNLNLSNNTYQYSLGNGIGFFAGGNTSVMDSVVIASGGWAQDFGDLRYATSVFGSCSSSTRGVFPGGRSAPLRLISIDYCEFSSGGMASNFGNMLLYRYAHASCGNSITGLIVGGDIASITVGPVTRTASVEYVTISTTGNSQNFGTLTEARSYLGSSASSSRGYFIGGANGPGQSYSIVIDTTLFSSHSSVSSYGNLLYSSSSTLSSGVCSSSTRGLFIEMHDGAIPCAIQYIELSSSGSSVEFGNTVTTKVGCASCSSTTIGLFSGGSDGSLLSSIEYVHINTLGNSSEYGDLTVARMELTGCSDCHGGLA